jgi:MFS family permease
MVLIARLILGMGQSVAFPCYSKILAQHLPEYERGFANGAIIAGMKLGPADIGSAAELLQANQQWSCTAVQVQDVRHGIVDFLIRVPTPLCCLISEIADGAHRTPACMGLTLRITQQPTWYMT